MTAVYLDETTTFAQHSRPEQARLLRALNLDVVFSSAAKDTLVAHGMQSGAPILDLVGGHGAALFGHNHPHLVQVAGESLARQTPFAAQASVRAAAGDLCARLSRRVGATTGGEYVVTLGSTGADAVESAVRHACAARSRRLSEIADDLQRQLRRIRRDGLGDVEIDTGDRICTAANALAQSIDTVAAMQSRDPEFVSLARAFHGKTSAAGALTDQDELRAPGPRRLRLDDWEPDAVVHAFDHTRVPFCRVSVEPARPPRVTWDHLSTIAACFVEPIQGEGGVHEVPTATLRALRELADRHHAALVFDEIQSGMGRTGAFLASTASGVTADYYLMSKSLGGGMAKISAMLVESRQYIADFGRYHTSTFADDDFSASIADASLDLLDSAQTRIVEVGKALRTELDRLAARWPDVFVEVRGRGLLLGIELRAPTASRVLTGLMRTDFYGYVVAGHLLHAHRIRVMPTLSAPMTLRIQPSAYLERDEIDWAVGAFEKTAAVIRRGDFGTLCAHLAAPTVSPWRPPQRFARPRRVPATSAEPPNPPRVAFLANVQQAGDLRGLAPELFSWTDGQCAALLDRMRGVLEPFELTRQLVESGSGAQVDVRLIAVPVTSAQMVECQRAGHGSWLRSLVLDAVEFAVESGASVIGLGGYTSIVTNASRDVVEDDIRVTSGNSLTAACAFEQLRRHLAALPQGERFVGVLGALGNIGAVMAELLAPLCDSVTLVGRPGARPRLTAIADRLVGQIHVTDDPAALSGCRVIVTATNSPVPVIDAAHVSRAGSVVVCDVAVPGDVGNDVAALPNVTVVSGGRMRLPGGQNPDFPGTGLAPGIVYSCMAEAIALGFEPCTPSPSFGALTVDGVHAALGLATRHALTPCRETRGG